MVSIINNYLKKNENLNVLYKLRTIFNPCIYLLIECLALIINYFCAMLSSDKKMVQCFVSACYEAGMDTVVCSPGSRNAPLVIAFDEHPMFQCYVVHDERSAAFIGMGLAQQLNKPVGIVCTSGSAMLNYYPAVAEAYYQRIPLVVISADRPLKWINQGDGQTIVQRGVYSNHIDSECYLEETTTGIREKVLKTFEAIAFYSKGPVHFNIALEEPLYQTEIISDQLPQRINWLKNFDKELFIDRKVLEAGLQLPKKMILVGQMPKNEGFHELLLTLAADVSFAILVENTANAVSMKWIHCIDRTLQNISDEQLKDFAPDLLISFGGMIVSKRIKSFLRKFRPKMHWKVGYDFPEMNTYQALTHSFECTPTVFLRKLLDIKSDIIANNFGGKWKQIDFIAQNKFVNYLQNTPYSDLKVFELLLDCVPDNTYIHMGNSSVIRYCQLFDPVPSMQYFSNRGTSGIDGSVSTALGAALAKLNTLHVLIVGDISFFYDSNALWNVYSLPNLRIIIINNGGGGMFNILKESRNTKQNKQFFEAKHSFSAKYIAKTFDIDYFVATNENELLECMPQFYQQDENRGLKLLEIFTDKVDNHLILDDCLNSIT